MLQFSSLDMMTNIGIFAASAIVVWAAGTSLTHSTERIAERFGIGEAAAGVLILAGITSLPEIATSFTAARSGDAPLAVNNLLGSIALQIAVLAIADLLGSKRALTSVVPDPVVMLQGALHNCLLSLVALAVLLPDRSFLGAGYWSWGLLVGVIWSIRMIVKAGEGHSWIAANAKDIESAPREVTTSGSVSVLFARTAASALAILLAGFVVARSGEALAAQTGIGSSFMGMAFLALATSLPEVSTVFAAVRRGLYTMAISDIFGTNIFNVALLLGIDLIATGGPVLTRVGAFSAVAALIGILLAGLFLSGLIERRDRTLFRMGIDSVAVLVTYTGGLVVLYLLRDAL